MKDRPLTLGELISKLKTMPANAEVYYDFCGLLPDLKTFGSWRGVYEWFYIGYTTVGSVSVKELLYLLEKQVLNHEFAGYRGGCYVMREDAYVWVDDYGEAHQTAVIGVVKSDPGYVEIVTQYFTVSEINEL